MTNSSRTKAVKAGCTQYLSVRSVRCGGPPRGLTLLLLLETVLAAMCEEPLSVTTRSHDRRGPGPSLPLLTLRVAPSRAAGVSPGSQIGTTDSREHHTNDQIRPVT